MIDDDAPLVFLVCRGCGCTREQRMAYVGGCPMRYPSQGCPQYDAPRDPPPLRRRTDRDDLDHL